MNKKADVIIPLADRASRFADAELRFCLRSLDRYGRNMGKIIIVTAERRDWFREVEWVCAKDERDDCKDANIIQKVLAGLSHCETRRVVWMCDDCALLRPVDLYNMPTIYNKRGRESFERIEAGKRSKWQRRMLRTFAETNALRKEWGVPAPAYDMNFDTHTPQTFDACGLDTALRDALHRAQGDVCINTWAGYYLGLYLARLEEQGKVKATLEEPSKSTIQTDFAFSGKVFVGYNDKGFEGGARTKLSCFFPEYCRYEARGEGWAGGPIE